MIDVHHPCGKNSTPLEPKGKTGSLFDKKARGQGVAPSPVKGRAGEGLAFLPYNKNLTALARENRKNPTPAERKIWQEVLRIRQFADYKFLRQKPLAGYIVDFYCSELRLVIEIDGESHAETVEYDAERTKTLQSLGLTVVRYTNADVILNIAGVFDDLRDRIDKLTPLDPPLSGGKAYAFSDKSGRGQCFAPSPVKGRAGEGLVSPDFETDADD